MRPIFPSRRCTIYEEDEFYSSQMIVIKKYFQIDVVFHDLMVLESYQMQVWR